jgi:hypothetical protein
VTILREGKRTGAAKEVAIDFHYEPLDFLTFDLLFDKI